jgi:hypothetical protein
MLQQSNRKRLRCTILKTAIVAALFLIESAALIIKPNSRQLASNWKLGSSPSSSNALTDLLDSLEDERNVPSLEDWALQRGVHLADGVNLVDNGLGDWGVGLSENHTHTAKTTIMTVPHDLVLSSDNPKLKGIRQAVSDGMTTMEFYVPECLLMINLLWEKAEENTNWKPWLDTLPQGFNTGIYLDPLERSHVERLAPEFLRQQELQWNACYQTVQELLEQDLFSDDLKAFLSDSEDLEEVAKWAYSVVFTRSWRDPSGSVATLVPLGDMFNHDSAMANVAPDILEDGSVEMNLKKDVPEGSPLYLSYGISTYPARFLVTFGFWDRSTLYMDANLTVPEEFPVDKSQLVVSTRNGGITQDVWNVATYNVLKERDVELASQFAVATENQDEATLLEMCDKWDLEGALYLRLHVLRIISETYPDMDIAPENMSESPRRFGMIARYNNGLRDSWMRVASFLDEEIEFALSRRGGK